MKIQGLSRSLATVCKIWSAKSSSVRWAPTVGPSTWPVATSKLAMRH